MEPTATKEFVIRFRRNEDGFTPPNERIEAPPGRKIGYDLIGGGDKGPPTYKVFAGDDTILYPADLIFSIRLVAPKAV